MKIISRVFVFLAFAGLLSVSRATTIGLSDDFSGAALNGSNWSTILPFGSSSVMQSGGVVTTAGRGILATVAQFGSALTINGAFTMQSDLESFVVAFRTDL